MILIWWSRNFWKWKWCCS